MKKKYGKWILIFLLVIIITGCGKSEGTDLVEDVNDEEIMENGDISWEENEEILDNITFDIIGCDNCVFSFYQDHKHLGDTLTNYTKDIKGLKDSDNRQRRRFIGHLLDGNNHIEKAYVCGIEDVKVYCLEGGKENVFNANVKVLEKVFGKDKCTESDSRLACYNETSADIKKNGNVSVRIDDFCYITDGEIYCN